MKRNDIAIIKKIKNTDQRDTERDIGFFMVWKDEFLKKKKYSLKKFTAVAYGDSIEELMKNLNRVKKELKIEQDYGKRFIRLDEYNKKKQAGGENNGNNSLFNES